MSNVPQKYWGKTVTLRNKYTQEYLYADECLYGIMKERRYILTMRNKRPVPVRGDWILNTEDEGHVFTLKNAYYSEYLYAAGSNWYKTKGLFGFHAEPKFHLGIPPVTVSKYTYYHNHIIRLSYRTIFS